MQAASPCSLTPHLNYHTFAQVQQCPKRKSHYASSHAGHPRIHIIHTYSSSQTPENNTKTSIVNSMKVKHKRYATDTLDSSLHAMWYHFQ